MTRFNVGASVHARAGLHERDARAYIKNSDLDLQWHSALQHELTGSGLLPRLRVRQPWPGSWPAIAANSCGLPPGWRWEAHCSARAPWPEAATTRKKRKVVVITFGGGARDQETFAPEGQENIPHLMRELIPQSAFFTQVVNRGILGHYVATASLVTGVYETFNNFAAVPPANPTVFEYFRKDLKRPRSDAWVVAPSNGFNRIGESSHPSYGVGTGATVILPKHLLTAALAGGSGDYEHLLRDNYETPFYAPELGGREFELQQLEMLLKLSVDDFKAHARTLVEPGRTLGIYRAPVDAPGGAQPVVDHHARY